MQRRFPRLCGARRGPRSAALLAGFAGMILGGLDSLVLLRPFFGHREIGAWRCHGVLFRPDPNSGSGDDWWRRFFRRFAERLYGQPLVTADQEDGNQGRRRKVIQ